MQGVDNAAHIGGLLSGFIAALAFMPESPGNRVFTQADARVAFAICVCFLGFLAADCKSVASNPLVRGDSAYQQAVELLQNQKDAEALPLLSKAALLMPRVASVRWDRARAYNTLGRYDDALADCNSAIAIEPDNKTGYVVRSSVYHKKGDEQKAIQDLTKVIKLQPKNAMAYNNRAWEYVTLGNYQSALSDVDTAIKMDRTESTFYDTRGVAYCLSDKPEQALKDLNQALSMKHNEGAYCYHRSKVYEKLQEWQRAKQDQEKAAALGFKPEKWEANI
jgi:tetratricopeptide (TPR) repeat protein